MIFRIPKWLSLPWGYDVRIELVDEMRYNGEWDDTTRVIRIGRWLSPAEKRGTLLHELDHAYADWKLWVSHNVPIKFPQGMDPDPKEVDDEEVETDQSGG